MRVLSIVQQKGGVGKTTVAINLAGEMRQRGMSVVVVDADPQASAVAWSSLHKLSFDVKPELLTANTLAQWLRNVLKQQVDVIIVDTPAGLGPVFRAAVDVADLVLVPCGPSGLDLSAARQTLSSVTAAVGSDPGSQARVLMLPTRIDKQTPEGQQIARELEGFGEPVAPGLSHDYYFVRAFTQGVTVVTAAPASPASNEIRALTDFVLEHLVHPN